MQAHAKSVPECLHEVCAKCPWWRYTDSTGVILSQPNTGQSSFVRMYNFVILLVETNCSQKLNYDIFQIIRHKRNQQMMQ